MGTFQIFNPAKRVIPRNEGFLLNKLNPKINLASRAPYLNIHLDG